MTQDQIRHYEQKLAFEIDSWDLKTAMEAGTCLVVIDARSADAYAESHIPDAINIPHKLMSAETTGSIQRDALLVTYCDGIGCNASTKGALQMAKLGFDVRELIGGLDWWIRDGHPVVGASDSGGGGSCGCG